MVSVEGALGRRATLIVRESGTPLIGISGRPVGVLEKSAEVVVHDEVGAYTVVSYGGRNGYVLTENLIDQERLAREAASIFEQAMAGAAETHSGGRLVVLAFSAIAALAGAGIGTVLAVA